MPFTEVPSNDQLRFLGFYKYFGAILINICLSLLLCKTHQDRGLSIPTHHPIPGAYMVFILW